VRTLALAPPGLIDAWLLRQFPGRTLEELDAIDFARLWRASAVQGLLRAEDARDAQQAGRYQPTAAEWREIVRNDALAT
jgi:hypothetical protein